MRFVIDNLTVFAKFSYDDIQSGNIVTICNFQIWNDEGHKTFDEVAEVICDSRDRFVKDIGRKLSLRKVMHNLKFDKSFRAKVWQAYHDRRNNQ